MTDARVPTVVSSTGLAIPVLGFGTARIPASEVEHRVRLALDSGYRLLDTAAAYGNEEGIGLAIRRSGLPRDELLVTTKLRRADQGYSAALKAFEQSRIRLGLDVIDLYLIHWPLPKRDLYVQTWKALATICDRGLAKAIGVSNFTIPQLARLSRETGITPAVNQVELHPWFQQMELRRYHESNAIHTEAWSPLGAARACWIPPWSRAWRRNTTGRQHRSCCGGTFNSGTSRSRRRVLCSTYAPTLTSSTSAWATPTWML